MEIKDYYNINVMRTLLFILGSIGCLSLMLSCTDTNTKQKLVKSVKVDTVVANIDRSFMQYPGRVKAAQDVNLAFRVSGTIQKIYVKDGASVRAGQLLAELDPSDYQVQLNATEAKYNEVKAEADRVIALYKDGGTTPNNYDKAVYGMKQVTALYKHHKDELEYTKLYAPFNGYIQKHLFDAHETIGAGMPVLSMIGSGTPEVEINLPAADYIKKDHFTDFHCTFDLYPGKAYPLKLIGITPKANANQLYTIRLKLVVDKMPMPSPGMNTMVSIFYNEGEDSLLQIPSGALFHADNKSFVYVYTSENQKIHRCEVEIIRPLSDGKTLVASEDLKIGEQIVSCGVNHVKDGEVVKLVAPITETNIGGLL